VRLTAETNGLAGLDAAAPNGAASAERSLRTPPPPPRELTAEERLPTKGFEEPNELKETIKRPDGTVVTNYTTEIPFKFQSARATTSPPVST